MTVNEQTINYLNQRVQALEKALKESVELIQSNPNRQQIDNFIKSVGYENRNKTK